MATQISSLTTLVNNANSYDCFLPLVDPTLALDSRNVKVRISTQDQLFSNNFAVSNLISYSNYFGTGKDGSVTISSSAQISSSTSPAGLNNTLYGDTIVKNFQNLTINGGVLFTPLRACRGMVIYCTGNLTVNGTISMTGKGGGVVTKIAAPIGIATSTDSRYDLVDATLYFNNFSSSVAGGYGIPTHWNWAPSGSAWFSNYKIRIPLSGSVAGGGSATNSSGTVGSSGIFCCGGGGGGGGGPSPGVGGTGGRGTIFTGGAGGGAAGSGLPGNQSGTSGLYEAGGNGGANGSNPTPAIGPSGGAGNPVGIAGPSGFGNSGGFGVGGLLILIVRGSVTINGTISSNGATGGAGVSGNGGGGSGGGRIMVIYGGTYINGGTVVANGGSGGTGTYAGGAGGAGAITVKKVHV